MQLCRVEGQSQMCLHTNQLADVCLFTFKACNQFVCDYNKLKNNY